MDLRFTLEMFLVFIVVMLAAVMLKAPRDDRLDNVREFLLECTPNTIRMAGSTDQVTQSLTIECQLKEQ